MYVYQLVIARVTVYVCKGCSEKIIRTNMSNYKIWGYGHVGVESFYVDHTCDCSFRGFMTLTHSRFNLRCAVSQISVTVGILWPHGHITEINHTHNLTFSASMLVHEWIHTSRVEVWSTYTNDINERKMITLWHYVYDILQGLVGWVSQMTSCALWNFVNWHQQVRYCMRLV